MLKRVPMESVIERQSLVARLEEIYMCIDERDDEVRPVTRTRHPIHLGEMYAAIEKERNALSAALRGLLAEFYVNGDECRIDVLCSDYEGQSERAAHRHGLVFPDMVRAIHAARAALGDVEWSIGVGEFQSDPFVIGGSGAVLEEDSAIVDASDHYYPCDRCRDFAEDVAHLKAELALWKALYASVEILASRTCEELTSKKALVIQTEGRVAVLEAALRVLLTRFVPMADTTYGSWGIMALAGPEDMRYCVAGCETERAIVEALAALEETDGK